MAHVSPQMIWKWNGCSFRIYSLLPPPHLHLHPYSFIIYVLLSFVYNIMEHYLEKFSGNGKKQCTTQSHFCNFIHKLCNLLKCSSILMRKVYYYDVFRELLITYVISLRWEFFLKIVQLHPFQSKYSYKVCHNTINHQVRRVCFLLLILLVIHILPM